MQKYEINFLKKIPYSYFKRAHLSHWQRLLDCSCSVFAGGGGGAGGWGEEGGRTEWLYNTGILWVGLNYCCHVKRPKVVKPPSPPQ